MTIPAVYCLRCNKRMSPRGSAGRNATGKKRRKYRCLNPNCTKKYRTVTDPGARAKWERMSKDLKARALVHYLLGMKIEEIAHALNRQEKTVRSWMKDFGGAKHLREYNIINVQDFKTKLFFQLQQERPKEFIKRKYGDDDEPL